MDVGECWILKDFLNCYKSTVYLQTLQALDVCSHQCGNASVFLERGHSRNIYACITLYQ